MARIPYSSTTIGGSMLAEAVNHVRKARDILARTKALVESVSVGGTVMTNLEGSAEFNVASGKGSSFYDAVSNMKANCDVITDAAIAEIDMGNI